MTSYDLGNSYSWSSNSLRYDDLGRLYEQVGTYDSGRTWHTEWDVTDSEDWARQVSQDDISDSAAWSTLLLRYDELDRLYEQNEIRDDGISYKIELDVDGTEAWSRQVTTDDLPDSYTWASKTSRYDDQNRLYEQTGTYDDGRTWQTRWDLDGAEVWAREMTTFDVSDTIFYTELTNRYDDQNRLYEQTGSYDDGRTWHTVWDLEGTETWHQQRHIFDTANQYSWSDQIFEYDQSGNLLNLTVIDDPIV